MTNNRHVTRPTRRRLGFQDADKSCGAVNGALPCVAARWTTGQPESTLAQPAAPRQCANRGVLVALLILCGLLQLAPSVSYGQSTSVEASDATLNDVFFLDQDVGWAVGSQGVCWHTQNGGRTWHLQRSEQGVQLQSVHFVDRRTGWAVGLRIVPHSRRSQAVVLRTANGGRRWTPVDGLTLPALTHTQFDDARRGWAVGECSAMYPSGIFTTTDGGRSWSGTAGVGNGVWLSADRPGPGVYIATGTHGIRRVEAQPSVATNENPPRMQPLRALRMFDQFRGLAVGAGGLISQTEDGGRSWDPLEQPTTDNGLQDWYGLTVHQDHVWVVGAPGDMVLYSPDQGRTWTKLHTSQSTPLRSVCFTSATHGWAVGALGTILATRDGGRSWHVQRAGADRLALLGVFNEAADIPLPLLSLLAGDDGYVCGVEVLHRRDLHPGARSRASNQWGLHAGIARVGGTSSSISRRFPARESELRLPIRPTLAVWDRMHDDNAIQELESYLTQLIRQWRPDVLITRQSESPEQTPTRYLLNQALLRAVERSSQYNDGSADGLKSWKVPKFFMLVDDDAAAAIRISTSQLATSLGRSLADHSADAACYFSDSSTGSDSVNLRLVSSEIRTAMARQRVFGGVIPNSNGTNRRVERAVTGSLASLNKAAQKMRNLERLLAMANKSGGGQAWLAQVDSLTDGIPRHQAGQLIFRLAEGYAQRGQWRLAAESMRHFIKAYPTHANREAAQLWLLHYHSSAELQLHSTNDETSRVVTAEFRTDPHQGSTPTKVRRASLNVAQPAPTNSRSPAVAQSSVEQSPAQAVGKQLAAESPALFADPRVRCALAASQRNRPFSDSQKLYQSIVTSGSDPEWVRRAKAELWVLQQRGRCPVDAIACRQIQQRPHLDGRLDEPFWNEAETTRLKSAFHDDHTWPAAFQCAYDKEYLYVAVTCVKAPGLEYSGPVERTSRDQPQDEQDRVEILIDTDRDYATHYRIAVDSRGWINDSLWNASSWNPKLHVAAFHDEESWSVEMAIPLAELSKDAQRRAVWAFNVQRIVPTVGFQAVSHPAAPTPVPHGFALIRFE